MKPRVSDGLLTLMIGVAIDLASATFVVNAIWIFFGC